MDSCPETNDHYVHPCKSTWINPKMRRWFAEHSPRVSCVTSCQGHEVLHFKEYGPDDFVVMGATWKNDWRKRAARSNLKASEILSDLAA